MKKKYIQLLIFLGLGIFFIWFSVKDLTPEDVEIIKDSTTDIFNPTSLFFIFISMTCGAFAHYFRAMRNILLIDPLGYRVRKATAFYSVMTCYLANLAIPRLGEVLRCTFLQRYDKVPFQKSFGTVVVERVIDLIIFVALFVLIIFLNKGLLSELVISKQEGTTLGIWIDDKWKWVWSIKFIVLGALIAGFLVLFLVRRYKQRVNQQSKIFGKIKSIAVGLWQGLVSIKDLQHPYLFVVYTLAIWVFYYLGVYLCFFAFNFLQGLGAMPAFVVLVVGAIGFMIAQGGLGAYPLIVAGIVAVFLKENGIVFEKGFAQGLAAGWIGWTAQTIMILIVGFASLILASFLKVENRAVELL